MRFTALTGDIVVSSQLSAQELDSALEVIRTAADDISDWPSGTAKPPAGFARRGGDSWQLAIGAPSLSLRTALYVTACLRREDKSWRTRIAVAEGSGTLPPDGDTNFAHGEVFTASGRLLDALPGHALMSHATPGPTRAAFLLADHIAQGWTQAQARALALMLPPGAGPRSAAAEALGISRQAVDQSLHAAGFPALDAAMAELEAR